MTQSRDTFSEDDIRGYFDYLQRWISCDAQAVGLAGPINDSAELTDPQKALISKITEPSVVGIVKDTAKTVLDNAKALIVQDEKLQEIFTPYYAYAVKEGKESESEVTSEMIHGLRSKVNNYDALKEKRKEWKAGEILAQLFTLKNEAVVVQADEKSSGKGGYKGAIREQVEDTAIQLFKTKVEKSEQRTAYEEWMYRIAVLSTQFQIAIPAIQSIQDIAPNEETASMLAANKISEFLTGINKLNVCLEEERIARQNYLLEREASLQVAEEKEVVADNAFFKPLQNDLTIEGRPLVLDTETELQQLKDKIATKLIGLSLYTQRKETKAMLAEDKLTNGNIDQQIRRGKETEARFLLSLYNDAKREGITSAELERLENEFNAPEKFAKKNIFQKAWSWVKANPKIVAGAIVTGVIVTGLTVATMGAFGVIGAGVAGGAAIGANMATLTAVGGGFSSIGVGMGAVGTVATAAIGAAASFTGGVLLAFAAIGLGKGIKAATHASRDKSSSPVVKNVPVDAAKKNRGFKLDVNIVGKLREAKVSPEAPGAGSAPAAANAPEVAASASSNAPVAGVEAPAASSASEAAASEVSDVVAEAVSPSPRMGSRR